ncbi:MAG: pentapeptide repeat-containing protein [Pseudomonadota bacterium]
MIEFRISVSRHVGCGFTPSFLTLLAGAISTSIALVSVATAADITARDFALKLKTASVEAPLDVSDQDLSFLDLSSLNFKHAILTGVDLYGTDLTEADLSYVELSDTRIDRAVIIGTDFSHANLEAAEINLPTTSRDLSFRTSETAKFNGANLTGARVLARLHGADFRKAILRNADFSALSPGTATIASVPRNYLIGANFDGADLRNANFSYANMNFSTFIGADLRGANFSSAELVKADFTGAKLDGAIFKNADLRDLKGGKLLVSEVDGAMPLATAQP